MHGTKSFLQVPNTPQTKEYTKVRSLLFVCACSQLQRQQCMVGSTLLYQMPFHTVRKIPTLDWKTEGTLNHALHRTLAGYILLRERGVWSQSGPKTPSPHSHLCMASEHRHVASQKTHFFLDQKWKPLLPDQKEIFFGMYSFDEN